MPLQKTYEKNTPNPNLKDMSLSDMEAFISTLGKEKYRAGQIMKWIYQHGVESIADMTNLSKDFRRQMSEVSRISRLEVARIQTAVDGTSKILFRLEDGLTIESVLIAGKSHPTLCISTQAGCRMGCRFCLTGKSGFSRNLYPSEITDQVTIAKKEFPEGKDIGSIVIMGMGEPLDNYANVLKAIEIMSSDMGLSFSGRKITLSTCGIIPMIRQLGKDACLNLAVSLNAADNSTRNKLMPGNRQYPLEDLIRACSTYELPRRRRITFEYILIDQMNSSVEDAEKLARLLRGVRCKINLIAFNEYPGSPYRTPDNLTIEAFRNVLLKHNYTAVLRASKGRDIMAACGQLSGHAESDG